MTQSNLYLPYLMEIEKITVEAPGVRTFRLKFRNEQEAAAFDFRAGQFGEYSVFGEGESTFCIASSPTRKGYIECTFRQAGRVTTGLSKLEEGDTVGFRDRSATFSRSTSGKAKTCCSSPAASRCRRCAA